tara:strand:- start:857 stop:1225 length:369 start_codon:yes stop_codon:yes gene_type:complete
MFVELAIGVEKQEGLVLIPRHSLTSSNEVYVVIPVSNDSTPPDGIPEGRSAGIYGKVSEVVPLHSVELNNEFFWVVDTNSNELTIDSIVVTRRLFGVADGTVVAFETVPNSTSVAVKNSESE